MAVATDPEGARRLAERMAQAASRERPFALRGGYHAVSDVHESPVAAEEVLGCAIAALGTARSQPEADWIRPFRRIAEE